YAKVFETLLRLRGNYVWPAVWGRAFAEDDPDNHATAKAYGVVLGSSHEAPMMRGIEEWNRHALPPVRDSEGVVVVAGSDPYGGNGQWSFRNNAEAIKAYWADGIRRMIAEGFEGTVALGMRGNGDLCLSDGDGIELMEEIIAVQRQILCEITGTDPAEIPQAWALYKEVQRYWDQGLRPPEDVTVIFSDDNWGNLRKFPDPVTPKRAGGWGLYYHFDYVGDSRNYKWVDTANLANVWDQLHQAYRYGVDRLWVVNVGDLKGQELPLSFFLDFAWDPERFTVDGLAGELGRWEREFALLHFGPDQAAEIADLLHTYGVLQSRRKPELLNRSISLDPDRDLATDPRAVVYDDQASPFSLTNYREMERVTGQWQRLAERAERCGTELPDAWRDAYYELVLYQVAATANLYALRQAEFTNLLYARQGRSATNDLADECDARFASDQAMSDYYNAVVAGGKWRGFQTQSKVGYGDVGRYGPEASWQQPEIDGVAIADEVFPPVKRIAVPEAASMAVAIDGSDLCWPGARVAAVLPAFSPFQTQPEQYIEVFNRGMTPFEVRLQPAVSWLRIEPETAAVDRQIRAVLRVDWSKAPRGKTIVPILVKGSEGSTIVVHAIVEHRDVAQRARRRRGHVEANGYVSTAADHPTAVIATPDACWKRIPDIGRTGSGMEPFPVTASRQNPPGVGPRLEYEMVLFTTGVVTVWVHASTRNDTLSNGGPRYAIAFDEGCPQPVDITADTGAQDLIMNRQWERNTSDNVNRTATRHVLSRPGTHVLKLWMVDPTIVVHHLVVDTGGMLASYLGPPESYRFEAKKDRE
ncbi:MAG: glycosyl hydrolase 115 family protein, partial [Micromonosporaceae bacterium]|nr:glycosyl hydrolase 115 family protein [Micromonosporaceae bacterium]